MPWHKSWFSHIPRAAVQAVSPCCSPSAMVTQLESHVALSLPAKPAADGLHPLILQGPAGTAVALAASATSGLCPWGLARLRFGCAECHLQELLLPCDAAATSSCCRVFSSQDSIFP